MDKYLARFWQKVKKSEYGCWEWTAGKTAQGYGQFYHGRPGYAHRFAYERLIGPIPEGKMVRHECDNPACVRPSHLMLGDQFDNMADMYERGRSRHAKGERHGNAKLTEQQVIGIYKSTLPQNKIAAKFGVGTTCVRDIKNGRTWAHVTGHEKQENPYPVTSRDYECFALYRCVLCGQEDSGLHHAVRQHEKDMARLGLSTKIRSIRRPKTH